MKDYLVIPGRIVDADESKPIFDSLHPDFQRIISENNYQLVEFYIPTEAYHPQDMIRYVGDDIHRVYRLGSETYLAALAGKNKTASWEAKGTWQTVKN